MSTSRELKELRALRLRRNRAAERRFLAEGMRVVEDLVASPMEVHWVALSSSLEDTPRGRALSAAIARRGIPQRMMADGELAELAATESPQGVIAVAEIPDPDAQVLARRESPATVLVLDAVQDPGNFGTLARSAEALGAAAVIALPGTVDPWNPKSVRAAAGSSFRVPILQLEWGKALADLRAGGFLVVGADAAGPSVREIEGKRVALVVGNEGAGLSPAVRESVDALAAVPLRGRAESLNVAAAAAILLYELSR